MQFFAQEIIYTLKILDKNLELPVESASITVFKTKENYLSNKEGIVKFNLKGSSFIEISHQDFKTQKIRIISSSKPELTVYLDSKIPQLEEVIVTQNHPQDILKNVVNFSVKSLTLPANLKIYSKEFYKYNDENIFFSDGLLNFQLYKSSGSVKTDILIEQSRSIGLKNPIKEELWGYNLNFIMEKYYSFGYLDEILDKKSKKEYYFTLKSHKTNPSFQIIEVKPLDEIDKHMYRYKITFDYKLKIIHEIEIDIPENKNNLFLTKNDPKNRRLSKMFIKQIFLKRAKEYYLLNSFENIEYTKSILKKETKIEVKNIMHTTLFKDFLFQYSDKEVYKNKSLVLSNRNKVLTNYWDYDSGIYMNEEEKKILNYLELITPNNVFN